VGKFEPGILFFELDEGLRKLMVELSVQCLPTKRVGAKDNNRKTDQKEKDAIKECREWEETAAFKESKRRDCGFGGRGRDEREHVRCHP